MFCFVLDIFIKNIPICEPTGNIYIIANIVAERPHSLIILNDKCYIQFADLLLPLRIGAIRETVFYHFS